MSRKKAILMLLVIVAIFAVTAFACFAAEGDPVDVQAVFGTGLETVKTDFMGFIGVALPVALAIGGVTLAVKLGWGFFKRIGK